MGLACYKDTVEDGIIYESRNLRMGLAPIYVCNITKYYL